MTIRFEISGEPPRATAQQKKIAVVGGKPRMYDPPELKAVKERYYWEAMCHRPREPLEGAVAMTVTFAFGTKTRKMWDRLKITRPDTDNMIKALKDALTQAKYWNDDAQVAVETVIKKWVPQEAAGITVMIETRES